MGQWFLNAESIPQSDLSGCTHFGLALSCHA